MTVHTYSGTVLAQRHERIVHGDRGDYVEIAEEHINRTVLTTPPRAEWRHQPPWLDRVYYIEHRTMDNSWLKIYEQRRLVDYADYRIGFWYVSAAKVVLT